MKKLVAIFMSVVLVITGSIGVFASNQVIFKDKDYEVTALVKTEKYQKMEVKNLRSNTVQIIEYFAKSGTDSEINISSVNNNSVRAANSQSGNKNYKMKRIDDKVTIYQGNQVYDSFTLNEPNGSQKSVINGPANKAATQGNGAWSVTSSGYTSRSIVAGDLSYTIGIIAIIMGLGPVASVVVATATWYCSRNLSDAWYYVEVHSRIYDGWVQQRSFNRFYNNPNHDQVIGSGYSDITYVHHL